MTVVVPCNNFDVYDGFDRLRICDSYIYSGDHLKVALEKRLMQSFYINNGEAFRISENGIEFAIPELCWTIDVSCSTEYITDEAAWAVGALSSYLLIASHQISTAMAATFNYEESDPASSRMETPSFLGFNEKGVLLNKTRVIRTHNISNDVVELISSEKEVERARDIFMGSPGTLGERIKVALGWLARGRQAISRSEKLLHYFTSIESLFTKKDPNAPVSQNIARSISSIWTPDTSRRREVFDQIMDLYKVRSLLIHSGSRAVSKEAVDLIAQYGHTICSALIRRVDLNQSIDDFHRHLKDCSFGAPFQDKIRR